MSEPGDVWDRIWIMETEEEELDEIDMSNLADDDAAGDPR